LKTPDTVGGKIKPDALQSLLEGERLLVDDVPAHKDLRQGQKIPSVFQGKSVKSDVF